MARLRGAAIVLLSLMAFAGAAFAQLGPCEQEALNAHNRYRRMHGAPDLQWDQSLAAREFTWLNQKAAQGCMMQHSGGQENLYWGSQDDGTCGMAAAVDMWYQEKSNFNYKFSQTPVNDNRQYLVPGSVTFGHFLQVIWKSATRVGCWKSVGPNGCVLIGCAYDKGGQITDNVALLANALPDGTPVTPVAAVAAVDSDPRQCPARAKQTVMDVNTGAQISACTGGTFDFTTGRPIADLCPVSCQPFIQAQKDGWLATANQNGFAQAVFPGTPGASTTRASGNTPSGPSGNTPSGNTQLPPTNAPGGVMTTNNNDGTSGTIGNFIAPVWGSWSSWSWSFRSLKTARKLL